MEDENRFKIFLYNILAGIFVFLSFIHWSPIGEKRFDGNIYYKNGHEVVDYGDEPD